MSASPHPTSRAGASLATLLGALGLAGCATSDGPGRTQTLPGLSLLTEAAPQGPQNPQGPLDPPDVPQAPQVPEQDEPKQQEESEVLDERRRGAAHGARVGVRAAGVGVRDDAASRAAGPPARPRRAEAEVEGGAGGASAIG